MKLALVLLLMLAAPLAQAQNIPKMQKQAMQRGKGGGGSYLELTGFGGFAPGKELYQAGGATLGLEDGATWGGRVGYHPNAKLGIEASYARMNGALGTREGATGFPEPAPPLGELKVQQLDAAVLVGNGGDQKAATYLIGGIGVTRFDGDQAESTGTNRATRFAWLGGLGARLRMGDKTALRLEGRYRSTSTDSNEDVLWTDQAGNAYGWANHWYKTWEFTAGLALKL